MTRYSLALLALLIVPIAAHAADLPVTYTVDEKALKTAVAGTNITFLLYTDSACAGSIAFVATAAIENVDFVSRLKLFKPKNALVKPPKTDELRHTLNGVTATGNLFLKVMGTGITAVGGNCQAQAAQAALQAPPPAMCADGVVNIDQSRALAGGVTSVDTPGFPVTLGDPGSYRLTGNVVVPAGTLGIYVTTSNVSIDLNGFTLQGPNTSAAPCTQVSSGNGIVANGATVRNTTVINGNVQGFQFTGISLFGGARIERVRAFWNCNVGMDVRADSFMSENQAYQNEFGIVIGAQSVLRGNVAYRNNADNLRLLLPNPMSTPIWKFNTEEWRVNGQAPVTPPTIPQEQFAATGTDTFAADMPTVIGD